MEKRIWYCSRRKIKKQCNSLVKAKEYRMMMQCIIW
jgi:hypothetical protein